MNLKPLVRFFQSLNSPPPPTLSSMVPVEPTPTQPKVEETEPQPNLYSCRPLIVDAVKSLMETPEKWEVSKANEEDYRHGLQHNTAEYKTWIDCGNRRKRPYIHANFHANSFFRSYKDINVVCVDKFTTDDCKVYIYWDMMELTPTLNELTAIKTAVNNILYREYKEVGNLFEINKKKKQDFIDQRMAKPLE